MVSTRGVKLKFFDGERVLCYEPDPTKAKVLYDSKVLQVIVNKDPRGRKTVEYLIHFQGWNSSWDRCVSEDFVLKDTPENRQLQKDLADKAQLQLGAYLYRRERKKRSRKLSERIAASSEEGSSESPTQIDTDDAITGVTTSSESNSSGDEEIVIPLELTATLRHALEHDNFLINTKNKILRLPAEPNIVNILEKFWKYYTYKELSKLSDKSNTRNRNSTYGNVIKYKPEHAHKNINTCKEFVDGLRIYFDYTLSDLLLYNPERDQVILGQANEISISPIVKPEIITLENVKLELEELEESHLLYESQSHLDEKPDCSTFSTKRRLRSHKSVDSECNGNQDTEIKMETAPRVDSPQYNFKFLSWDLLPDHIYSQHPPPPCLIYGATHLARLLVKLPDLLHATSITSEKLKCLLSHLDFFVEYLSRHNEWFGDKFYIDNNLLN